MVGIICYENTQNQNVYNQCNDILLYHDCVMFAGSTFTDWSEWKGHCCNRFVYRTRSCMNDLPGLKCYGSTVDKMPTDCKISSCSKWSDFTVCSNGIQSRVRVCSDENLQCKNETDVRPCLGMKTIMESIYSKIY